MGRSPCHDESTALKKGPWSPEEDQKLTKYVQKHGHGSWGALPKLAGLNRCGKSCRLRWINYLRPDIKRGKFSQEEEETIIRLHSIIGNKWSKIATHLPGRTDNEIKNFWNAHLRKKLLHMGIDPMTHRAPQTDLMATLPQLLALAGLGDIVGGQPWIDHVVRLQEEASKLVKLQCFQYLLQKSETAGSILVLISTTNSKMEGSDLLPATVAPALTSTSSPGAVLPSFGSTCSLRNLSETSRRLEQAPFGNDIKQDSVSFGVFRPEAGRSELSALFSHPSTSQSHACVDSLAASLLDACSTSSWDGSFDSSFWPDQLIVEEKLLVE